MPEISHPCPLRLKPIAETQTSQMATKIKDGVLSLLKGIYSTIEAEIEVKISAGQEIRKHEIIIEGI